MFSDICVVFLCLCSVLQVVIFDCVLCFTYLSCVLYICIVFYISVLCFMYPFCVLHICVVFCMSVLCFAFVLCRVVYVCVTLCICGLAQLSVQRNKEKVNMIQRN